jgi:hypothetical protein
MEESKRTPGWQLLVDRIAEEPDPIRRRNLEVVARHVVEEVAGNLSELMATLVPEPEYTVWGASDSTGPKGRQAVVAWYEALKASGRNRLDYKLHRVVVDDRCVVTEGDFHYAIAGHDLRGVDATESGEALDADTWYLVTHRALVLWPVNSDGLIEGEIIYAGEHHRVRRALGEGEMPNLGPDERATS